MASRELGDEAMLIYSRETLPEARYLGQYEVVFALEAEPAPGGAATAATAAVGAAGGGAESAARGGAAMEAARMSGVGQARAGEDAGVRGLEAEMAALRAQMRSSQAIAPHSAGADFPTNTSNRS